MCFRGVFQALVEKHFPAPDRERINRLLGLEGKALPPTNGTPKNGLSEDANSTKRKCEFNIMP